MQTKHLRPSGGMTTIRENRDKHQQLLSWRQLQIVFCNRNSMLLSVIGSGEKNQYQGKQIKRNRFTIVTKQVRIEESDISLPSCDQKAITAEAAVMDKHPPGERICLFFRKFRPLTLTSSACVVFHLPSNFHSQSKQENPQQNLPGWHFRFFFLMIKFKTERHVPFSLE